MLELHRRLLVPHSSAGPAARLSRGTSRGTPQEKEMLQRDTESTDQAIDALVYQLYGLTQAEIKIVETA